MQKKLIGAHFSISKGFEDTFYHASECGATSVQIFLGSNRSWNLRQPDPSRIKEFQNAQKKFGIFSVIAHASYLINLAAAKELTLKKSIQALEEELLACDAYGIEYLVLHPGASTTLSKEEGLAQISQSLNHIFNKNNFTCTLLLETMAGQGTMLGASFEELATIHKNLKKPEKIGFCWDTCHLFSSGYALSSTEELNNLIKDFDKKCGLSNLKAIHLNDSKTAFDSRVDRHANINEGSIGLKSLKRMLDHEKLRNLPFILETPLKDESYSIYKDEILILTKL